jgi:putative transposase
MPNNRRAFVPGGCWFFTVNLFDGKSRLLVDHIDALREAVRATQERYPFQIDARTSERRNTAGAYCALQGPRP